MRSGHIFNGLIKNMTTQKPVVHFEMAYKDAARASKFYEEALGWKMNNLGKEMNDYIIAQTTETDENGMTHVPSQINGGLFPAGSSYPDSNPSVVVATDDLMASIEDVKKAGGEILGFPIDIPGVGKYIGIKDTEGNRLGMLQPLPMN